MMHFDWTIALGTVLQTVVLIAGLVIFLVKIGRHMGLVEARLQAFTERLDEFASRLVHTEEAVFKLAQDLQRVIGRLERP